MSCKILKTLLGAALVSSALATPLTAAADIGVQILATDGSVREIALPDLDRLEIGSGQVTLRTTDGNSEARLMEDIDRIMIGTEVSSVTTLLHPGEIAVWPTAVTSTVNIAGAASGTAVAVWSAAGIRVASARCGEDTLSLDLSALPAGVYIVTVGQKSVKISKN